MSSTAPIAPHNETRPWKRAALWLAFLGPFFFISYGFANWWTGQLGQVDSIVFAWEKHIPFWDWTILPYMSIDAFYAVSLFLCTTRAELDTHAKRLLCATVVSVACFLLFPLQFSFARPETSGFNGALFDVLTGFDKPFNQAPSLHISLLILLWIVYARHLRGIGLWLLHGWFFLIGISVFTTYQHHVVDGIAGAVVGILCVYLFPDRPVRWDGTPSTSAAHRRLQRLYITGAAICMIIAYGIQGWAWLLLWPGIALLLVGIAYARFGVTVFQKHQGRSSWPARMLLAPHRLGAWLSSRWFTRNQPPGVEIVPGLWIGRAPGRLDWRDRKISAILDLTAEFHGPALDGVHYRNVPMLDLVVPTPQQLQDAVTALDVLYGHAPVLVHCALGYSRSALVVAAWLLQRKLAATPQQAVDMVRTVRPQITLSAAHLSLLETLAHD